MTLLVTSIVVNKLDEVETRAQQAWTDGSDAVELRIDTYDDDPAALADYLRSEKDRTWIVTCRSTAEGGRCAADAMQRASLVIGATRGTDAYVDLELGDWRQTPDVRRKIQVALTEADDSEQRSHGVLRRLILSAHSLEGGPGDLPTIVDEALGERKAGVVKVAYRAADIHDSFAALDLMHKHGNRVIAVAMDEHGLWSRLLTKKLGAFASYSCLTPDSATAPGQLTLRDMLDRYRFRDIDAETRVFGVLGDPVAHSMSPALFNRWFADAKLNAVYLPLRVTGGCLERFLSGCVDRPWLDVGGFSVTLPHKTNALRWVGDGAERPAASIGAINTLTFRDGRVIGHNTDRHAAIASMMNALGCSRGELVGMPVDLLGTGGAARAVLAGLRDFGCRVTIYGRSPERTGELAQTFGATPASWADRSKRVGEILINCTSVGMWPDVDTSPMPAESLDGCRLVFDLIYNPLKTQLLKDAAAAGAKTLNGLDMFIRQAAQQFGLWTSKTPDTVTARELITREIRRRTSVKP